MRVGVRPTRRRKHATPAVPFVPGTCSFLLLPLTPAPSVTPAPSAFLYLIFVGF